MSVLLPNVFSTIPSAASYKELKHVFILAVGLATPFRVLINTDYIGT